MVRLTYAMAHLLNWGMEGDKTNKTKEPRAHLPDLRRASDEARALVAATPDDEQAAEHLFDLVSRVACLVRDDALGKVDVVNPVVSKAARLLEEGASEEAEIMLRRYLAVVRNEPDAMLLMANIAAQCGFADNAEKILRRSLEIHPGRARNWLALAHLLHDRATKEDRVGLVDDALLCVHHALTVDPDHEDALGLRASLLVKVRRLEEGHQAFECLVRAYPENVAGWINFAHLLKTRGFFGEAIAAYRTAIALEPGNVMGWWLLADLKLARFFPNDIRRMRDAMANPMPELAEVDLHFALAAALHQARDFGGAAEHLRLGNALRLKLRPHDVKAMRAGIDAAIRTYNPTFFEVRPTVGERSRDPIFVVGMPRSGSTLVEQILSSHSAIEGTAELFAVQQIEVELFRQHGVTSIEEIVDNLDIGEFERLGRRYLELTRFNRRTARGRFVDKNPGNWRQIGFIHAMLPNAKIVDIRRNPMDCCFANYSQHFMVGVNYSYGFDEMASQYCEYIRLMRHFDQVLPGRIHRVIYEDLVGDFEGQVDRLIAYLELPYEDACLRFFENERPVHTPSSQQVRQPINRAGIGKWKDYEPWLGDLASALGDARDDWWL